MGGLMGKFGGGGHGGGGGMPYGGQGGYGGGYQQQYQQAPQKSGGMGMGGAMALGAGGLVGGLLIADAINDNEQEAYQEGVFQSILSKFRSDAMSFQVLKTEVISAEATTFKA